ncbi:glycerol dehydrogenase [Desulfoscipio geothermicus]|uniref:Glycerol dehydrogenase n=1 Tax=Desulfoscipio geothermicus DSM 3669 TaxID=1121426 RepID=A0A1I6D695_9FIRM|nr:glycerol dehydrogenase [Desulfoscipio geothermicus]SFR00847.1 glycerol dehydrogenase [Desulfoscipio geothermicus DSM 3669]
MKDHNDQTLKSNRIKYSNLPSVAAFPGKYIQGPGSLKWAADFLGGLGDEFLICSGKRAWAAVETTLTRSFKDSGIGWIKEFFTKECTQREIECLVSLGRKNKVKAVIGVGGGKVIDTAKVVAQYLDKPVVIIPTVASTDAPTSALSVIYTDKGEFSHYEFFNRNPDIVLVDTEVIAKSPIRFFVSGMGGAIGVSYEAEACYKSEAKTISGGRPSLLAIQCAKMARETLLEYGGIAKLSAENGVWGFAFERCVEANLLLSGIGFESGGLAVAHSIYHGYRSLGKKDGLHGEVVAFGTLVQMLLEGRSKKEIKQIVGFFKDVGLPCTLSQLGMDYNDRTEINKLANIAWEQGTASNMFFDIEPVQISDAIILADRIGCDSIKFC